MRGLSFDLPAEPNGPYGSRGLRAPSTDPAPRGRVPLGERRVDIADSPCRRLDGVALSVFPRERLATKSRYNLVRPVATL